MHARHGAPLCALLFLGGCALTYPPLPPTVSRHVDTAGLEQASIAATTSAASVSLGIDRANAAKAAADKEEASAFEARERATQDWEAARDYNAIPEAERSHYRRPAKDEATAERDMKIAERHYARALEISKKADSDAERASGDSARAAQVAAGAKSQLNDGLARKKELPTLDEVLDGAAALQDTYRDRYEAVGPISDVLQLPVIAAAALGANRILNGTRAGADQADAARDLGKIGIIIGTFTAARGALWPANLTRIYADGYNATGCVLARGTEIEALSQNFDDFNDKRLTVAAKTTELEELMASVDPSVAGDLVAEKKLADMELANARTAQTNAGLEARAHEQQVGAFQSAISALAFRVVVRALARQSPDYKTLREELFKAPAQPAAPDTTGTDSGPNAGLPRSLKDFPGKPEDYVKYLRVEIVKAVDNLVAARSALEVGMPNYVDRLQALTSCLDLAGPAPGP